jgi:succinyl-CoA synthetase beta subunit
MAVKAQVHAGGRGLAGGIKLVDSPTEAEEAASSLLNTRLVTHQTDARGLMVNKVLVEEVVAVEYRGNSLAVSRKDCPRTNTSVD